MKRRTAWFLVAGVVALALGAAMVGAVALLLRGGAPRIASGQNYLVLDVQGEIPETPAPDVPSWFERRPPGLPTLVQGLERAAGDPDVTGVILRVGLLTDAGWARTEELRDALLRFRKSKKPVYAHVSDFCSNREYYLASAADKVFAIPSANLALTGLYSELSFWRETLGKVGVEAQFEAVGKYKSAPDAYTGDGLSEANREQLDALLDDLEARFVEGIASGRKLPVERVRELIAQGPYEAREAKELGLVDELLYLDEAEARIKGGRLSPVRYARESRGFGLGSRPRIALIYAVGTIMPGESDDGPFGGGGFTGSETVIRALRKAREDDAIKAVVLRVDSPGGSATASDQIWHELRRTAEKKPVIASMGDYAASGGYYVAMGAHAIVAQPNTVTGSIGVFSGKFNLQALYEKIGLRTEVLRRGPHADIYSSTRPWDAEERARVRRSMEAFYAEFVSKAAEGRKKTPVQIDAVAQGRVWSGRAALEVGLVDELGGLDQALDLARDRARIGRDEAVAVVVLPERKGFFDVLMEQPDEQVGLGRLGADLQRAIVRADRLFDGRPLALLPYELKIR